MDVPTQLELCLYDQLDSYIATCFLTFIVIRTQFFKFKFLFISIVDIIEFGE